jgi:ADP-ribose pyrophosphatase YjhB (NUDIX family)
MESKKDEFGFIPQAIFDQIVGLMPIASVDAVIMIDGSLLLLKRKINPAAGQWWFVGGRINKGESFEQTLRREVEEETGLEIESFRFINVYSRFLPERHDVTLAYLCKCRNGKIRLDDEHSEYKLFKELPNGLHPYLLETLQDSKWKKHLKCSALK